MQTYRRTIVRRGHWRNQRYGPGRVLVKRVYVRPVRVTLPPSASRQLDMLDAMAGYGTVSRTAGMTRRPVNNDADEPEIIRSYWRQQPYGPRRRYRRMTLIDVRHSGTR